MSYYNEDWSYLVRAFENGGACEVNCPAARASLVKLGFMAPANLRGYGGQPLVFGMALTKKGHKRASAIREQRMGRWQRKSERRAYHLALGKRPRPVWQGYW